MPKPLPPLGRLRQAVEEATGLEITHVHEDLVFIENGAFLFRFDPDRENLVHVHFHGDSDPTYRPAILTDLSHGAKNLNLQFREAPCFVLEEVPDRQEVTIRFQD